MTLQAQALRLWKNTPYLRLRDSMGIPPIFLSSLNGMRIKLYSSVDTRNVMYSIFNINSNVVYPY